MPIPENQIIGLLHSNPASAIEPILDQYGDAVYGLVCRMIPQRELADEVVQDVMVKVWQNAASYNPAKGKLYTWLASIAWNTALDKIRSAGYRQSQKSESLDSSVYVQNMRVEENPGDVGLQRAISRLDAKYREVIDLVYFGGYSQSEVSEQLNIPIGTVKSRIRIAIRELHAALRDEVLWVGIGLFFLFHLILQLQ